MTQTVPVLFVLRLVGDWVDRNGSDAIATGGTRCNGGQAVGKEIRLNMRRAVVIPADLPQYAASVEW